MKLTLVIRTRTSVLLDEYQTFHETTDYFYKYCLQRNYWICIHYRFYVEILYYYFHPAEHQDIRIDWSWDFTDATEGTDAVNLGRVEIRT